MSTFVVDWNTFKTFIGTSSTTGLVHCIVQPNNEGGARYTFYTTVPDGTEYKTVILVQTPEQRLTFEQLYLTGAKVIRVIKRETTALDINIQQKEEFYEEVIAEPNNPGDLDDAD